MDYETAERFRARPKRGVAGQIGRWRLEVREPSSGACLETRTLRAAESIAELLNGEAVEVASNGDPPRYEALPQTNGWLIVRLELRGTAVEIARTADEALAVRVASLLTRHAPRLDARSRRSLMRPGMQPPT